MKRKIRRSKGGKRILWSSKQTARLSFYITAESEEEAKEKLFNANCPISLIDDEDKEVCEIHEQEWDMIDKEARGYVREPHVADFEIYEEE